MSFVIQSFALWICVLIFAVMFGRRAFKAGRRGRIIPIAAGAVLLSVAILTPTFLAMQTGRLPTPFLGDRQFAMSDFPDIYTATMARVEPMAIVALILIGSALIILSALVLMRKKA